MAFVDDDEFGFGSEEDFNEKAELAELKEKRRMSIEQGLKPINLPSVSGERVKIWKESMTNPKVRMQLVRLLQKTLIFADSSESFRKAVVDFVVPVEYWPGQVIFAHGDPGDWMGIVISGRLERKLQRQNKDIHIGDVGPGGIIGDLGVFGITPTRSFTVTSLTKSAVLVLSKQDYEEAIAIGKCAYSLSLYHDGSHMFNLMADMQSFLDLRCFQGLDHDFVLELRENSEPRLGFPNQTLMKENHFGDEMYILRAGAVKIWKNEKFVVQLPAGVVLGELAVLGSDKRRTATVTCSTLCLIRALHADVFHEILERFPAAKRVFDHAYVARLVSVEVNNAKEEMAFFNGFYGSAQPKSSQEMQNLFGSTLKIEDKRAAVNNRTSAVKLPALPPRGTKGPTTALPPAPR